MIADLSKSFKSIFEFCVAQNFKSKDEWHPEKKASIDVKMYGCTKSHPTVMTIHVFPNGREWLQEANVKFIVVSDKPYCEMYRKHKFCKEIKIETVVDEIEKVLNEINEESEDKE